jgi:hypothetical protein
MSERAAAVAWIAPAAGVAAVGVSDRLALPENVLVASVAIGVAVGVLATIVAWATGARRGAAVGAIVNGVVIAGVAIALFAGARDQSRRAADSAELRKEGATAAAEYPGWYGTGGDGRVRLFALELDARSELAQKIAAGFDGPVAPLVVGLDNRGGDRDVELDLTELGLTMRDGTTRVTPPRAAILARAKSEALRSHHAGVYRVAPGTTLTNALGFLDGPMQDVTALSVVVDGHPVTLSGRWYTADEKRARRR